MFNNIHFVIKDYKLILLVTVYLICPLILFQEDIKSLWMSVVEKFGEVLAQVDYVQTFHALRMRYEQHQDRLRDRDRNTSLDG